MLDGPRTCYAFDVKTGTGLSFPMNRGLHSALLMEDSVFIAEGMNALQTAVFLNVTDLEVAVSWCGEPLVPVSVRI